MAKEKKRSRIQNPQPFISENDSSIPKKKSKSPKHNHHHDEDKLISSNLSSKILKQALIQQKEVEEENDFQNRNPNSEAFSALADDDEVEINEKEEDIDDFDGFDDTQSRYNHDEEINEEDEKLLDAFLLKDAGPQRTLADLIVEKIKRRDATVSSETRSLPKLDQSHIELYKGVGRLLSRYTSGKIPKAVKHIPAMQLWEDILVLTEPENWSPNAVYQATRIFSSNMGAKKAERFYKLVLLPRVRKDIRENKRLHFALYQALKKSLYKPAAFNKGILLPLCQSGTCTLREAVIIGSIIQKVSIPHLHSSVALLKLAEMEYCGTTSYFIKLLIEKKYALPHRVVGAVVAHFMRFLEDTRIMPVIWHQSLLAFVQRYRNELSEEYIVDLKTLVEKQRHKLVTPEILWELNNSRNRGEKAGDQMLISSIKAVEEDRFDIPEVPMEED